jgi:NAD(P)-dependent dehydrogenase (short-subunit alcohol dehydrogenase family)
MSAAHSEGGAWNDRVVVVTGGNSGIGRAFVERLAAEGAKVVACGRNEVTLKELQSQNPAIAAFRCDITARRDVLALAKIIQKRYGKLDVLINNAGSSPQAHCAASSMPDTIRTTAPASLTSIAGAADAARATGAGSGTSVMIGTKSGLQSLSTLPLHSPCFGMLHVASRMPAANKPANAAPPQTHGLPE